MRSAPGVMDLHERLVPIVTAGRGRFNHLGQVVQSHELSFAFVAEVFLAGAFFAAGLLTGALLAGAFLAGAFFAVALLTGAVLPVD